MSTKSHLIERGERFASAIVAIVGDVHTARVVTSRGKVGIVLGGVPAVDGERIELVHDGDGFDYSIMDRVGEKTIEQVHAAWCQARGYV